ncbi:hypothetical protein C2E31_08050 [Rhodopirellula baltica]|nr:hypothetical protein C2E31_08050 [Rhodopirellula baltica]
MLESPSLLGSATAKTNTLQPMGGMIDGQGQMGGGMFRIPDNVLPQMGGGMGGMGGFVTGTMLLPQQMTREALKDIVLNHVNGPDAPWNEMVGSGGELSLVGPLLIVTHTPEVHQRIANLLELLIDADATTPSIQLDIRFVQLEPSATESLTDASSEKLKAIAADDSAARITLRCDNHRAVEIASGLKRSYIVSLTPVVGSSDLQSAFPTNVAYRPETETVLLGLFGKVIPDVDVSGESARIRMGIEMASAPEEVLATNFGNGQTTDRIEIESAKLETSITVDANEWTVAGTVALTNAQSIVQTGEALQHLTILVHWKIVK